VAKELAKLVFPVHSPPTSAMRRSLMIHYRNVFGSLSYVAVLVFVLIGAGWLEFVVRTRVFARPRRLVLTILIVVWPFLVWDGYAISQGHWWFDESRILGVYLPGEIPLDELLFFIVIPIASILTLEAVRSVKGWPVGDGADAQ
jgi:lycopene cyclase domain-containing protein